MNQNSHSNWINKWGLARRAKGKKPMWDIIHPGRAWAEELSAALSSETVLSLIARHFDNVRVPPGKFEV